MALLLNSPNVKDIMRDAVGSGCEVFYFLQEV